MTTSHNLKPVQSRKDGAHVVNRASLSQIAQDCISDPDFASIARWQTVLLNPSDGTHYSRRTIERFRNRRQNINDLIDQILFNAKIFIMESREKYDPKERLIDQLLINHFGPYARMRLDKGLEP